MNNLFTQYLLACAAMVIFFSLLFLEVWGAERWSPWAVPIETPTPTMIAPVVDIHLHEPTPTPTLPPTATSELREPLPTPKPSIPVVGGNFPALPLPDNTTVVSSGVASDGATYPYCFYWAPTHEIVLMDGCNANNRVHEYMHAHQHWSINGGAPLRPADYDLSPWYDTAEGRSFTIMAAGLSWPWARSAVNGLEDFAWTATFWYTDPEYLVTQGGQERYDWARSNLP